MGGTSHEPLDQSMIKAWNVSDVTSYYGNYHLHESEAEQTFSLKFKNDTLVASIESGNWSTDGKQNWILSTQYLKNARVEGNKFYSDEWNGEFMIAIDNKPYQGIVLFGYDGIDKESNMIQDEFGTKNN